MYSIERDRETEKEFRYHIDCMSNCFGYLALYTRPVTNVIGSICNLIPAPLEQLAGQSPCFALSAIPSQIVRYYEVMTTYSNAGLKHLRQAVIIGDIYYYTVLGAMGVYTTIGAIGKYHNHFNILYGANCIFRVIEMGLIYRRMQHSSAIGSRLLNLSLEGNVLDQFTDEELSEHFMVLPGEHEKMRKDAEGLTPSEIYTKLHERFALSKKMDKWRMVAAAISAIGGALLLASYLCPVTAPVVAILQITAQSAMIATAVLGIGIWAYTYPVETKSLKA